MTHERVAAVERALALLEAFGTDADALTLADLAARTGLYKSTILRLSRSLVRFGYLTRRADGAFRPGPSLWRLGSLYRRGFELGEHVRPTLRRLRDRTRETASFYVRDGDARVCLYRENADRAIRHHLEEGARLPLDRGAAGRVLVAFGPDAPAAGAAVRTRGFAVSLGERDPEVGALAVPVRAAGVGVRGALALSGPIGRFDEAFRRTGVALLMGEAAALEGCLPGRPRP